MNIQQNKLWKTISQSLLLCLILLFPAKVLCLVSEFKPEEMLIKSDEARGNTSGFQWEIVLVSVENQKTQKRILELKSKNYNSVVRFLSPAKMKNRRVLMVDRNMWFIKPGLRKPVPISPRQKLMGSASNGDIASTNYAGDYDIVKVENIFYNGQDCFVFDLKGKNKKVTYDRIKYWISKKDFLGIKAEFYTISGKMFKTATMEYNNKIKKKNKVQPFISKMTIQDAVSKQNVTTMQYRKIKIKKIADSVFNINLLLK